MRTVLMVPAIVAGLTIAGLGAGQAFAAAGKVDSEATAAGMQVSLAQAIATAEQQTGGKAYDVGVDTAGGQHRLVVETYGPKGTQTVMVDGTSGKVVGGHAGGEAD